MQSLTPSFVFPLWIQPAVSSRSGSKGPNEISHIDFAANDLHANAEALYKVADKNGDGVVTKRELKRACQASPEFMKELGLHRVFAAKEFFDKADEDKGGNLSLKEFKNYIEKVEAGIDQDAERRHKLILTKADEKLIESTYDEMDTDGDHILSEDEIAACFLKIAEARNRKMKPDSAKQHAKKAMRHYNKGGGKGLMLEDFQLMVLRCPFADVFGDNQ
jgi:Ca2+-binding EF-hand superfamily protein